MKEGFPGLIRQKIELGEGKAIAVESQGKNVFISVLVDGRESALWRLDIKELNNEKGDKIFSLNTVDFFNK